MNFTALANDAESSHYEGSRIPGDKSRNHKFPNCKVCADPDHHMFAYLAETPCQAKIEKSE